MMHEPMGIIRVPPGNAIAYLQDFAWERGLPSERTYVLREVLPEESEALIRVFPVDSDDTRDGHLSVWVHVGVLRNVRDFGAVSWWKSGDGHT
jgi:hypothetical protein